MERAERRALKVHGVSWLAMSGALGSEEERKGVWLRIPFGWGDEGKGWREAIRRK